MSFFKEDYIPTCGDCKHACYYPNYWSWRWSDPKCEIHKKSIKHDDIACKDFKLIGRLSR